MKEQKGLRTPKCARCRNHHIVQDSKGHKHFCPFKTCVCELCSLLAQRQKFSRRQIGLRRKQVSELEEGETFPQYRGGVSTTAPDLCYEARGAPLPTFSDQPMTFDQHRPGPYSYPTFAPAVPVPELQGAYGYTYRPQVGNQMFQYPGLAWHNYFPASFGNSLHGNSATRSNFQYSSGRLYSVPNSQSEVNQGSFKPAEGCVSNTGSNAFLSGAMPGNAEFEVPRAMEATHPAESRPADDVIPETLHYQYNTLRSVIPSQQSAQGSQRCQVDGPSSLMSDYSALSRENSEESTDQVSSSSSYHTLTADNLQSASFGTQSPWFPSYGTRSYPGPPYDAWPSPSSGYDTQPSLRSPGMAQTSGSSAYDTTPRSSQSSACSVDSQSSQYSDQLSDSPLFDAQSSQESVFSPQSSASPEYNTNNTNLLPSPPCSRAEPHCPELSDVSQDKQYATLQPPSECPAETNTSTGSGPSAVFQSSCGSLEVEAEFERPGDAVHAGSGSLPRPQPPAGNRSLVSPQEAAEDSTLDVDVVSTPTTSPNPDPVPAASVPEQGQQERSKSSSPQIQSTHLSSTVHSGSPGLDKSPDTHVSGDIYSAAKCLISLKADG